MKRASAIATAAAAVIASTSWSSRSGAKRRVSQRVENEERD